MRRFRRTLWLGLTLGAGSVATGWAQQVDEASLKAAFVANFAAYVKWPQDQAGTLADATLCVRSGAELERSLVELDGRRIAGRKTRVRILSGVDELPGCWIIVVDSPSVQASAGLWPSRTVEPGQWPHCWWCRSGVLSVGNGGDAERNGTALTLFRDGNRIRFDVDGEAARQAQVELSSRLLRLAGRVL